MSVKLGEAVVYLIGDKSGVEGDLKETEKKTEGWAKNLAGKVSGALGTAMKIGVAGVATAIVGLGSAAFAAGMEMDEAMDTIATSTGATGDELKALGADFKAVMGSIPTDAGPASEAISELNRRTGMTGETLQDTSKQLLEMTRLLGGDAKNNATLLTRVMGDWGLSNEDAAGTLDKLFLAGQQTGASVEGLMQKVVQFGSPLRLMGFSLDQSIALFAKWEKEGVNAELVMGSLRIAAGQFAKAGVPLQQGLQETIDKIQNMDDASEALALGMEVFGARAGPDMTAAIREGRFAADDLIAAMQGAEGAIAQTADATADFPEKMKVFKNMVSTALAPLGIALMNIITMLTERFAPVLQALIPLVEPLANVLIGLIDTLIMGEEPLGDWSSWWETLAGLFGAEIADKISSVVTWIQTMATTIASFVTDTLIPFIQENGIPILAGLGTVLLAVVIPAFVAWATAAAAAAAATIAAIWPVAAPVLAIAAVVALLAKAWTSNWGDIQGKTATAVAFIRSTIEAFLAILTRWWDEHGQEVVATVTVLWETIQRIVSGGVEFVRGAIEQFLGAVRAWWEEHGQQVMELVNLLWEGIKNIVETVSGVISNLFLAFLALLRGDWEAFGEYLSGAWTTFWEGLKTHIETVMGLISGIIDLAWETIKETFRLALEAVGGKVDEWWTNISNATTAAWDFTTGVGAFIYGIWEDIKTTFTDALEAVYDAIDAAWEDVVEVTTSAWDFTTGVGKFFADLWLEIGRIFGESLQWIYDRVDEIWERMSEPLGKLWENFRNFWTTLFDNIHIKTPHFSVKWQDVFGVRIPTGVNVKWYGMGGDFMVYGPTLLGVGERGPERVIIQPSGAGAMAETMGVSRGGEGIDLDPTNGLLAQILANLRALVAGVQALQPAPVMDARALARQLEFEARVSR